MKAHINGIQLEGTPDEIYEYQCIIADEEEALEFEKNLAQGGYADEMQEVGEDGVTLAEFLQSAFDDGVMVFSSYEEYEAWLREQEGGF